MSDVKSINSVAADAVCEAYNDVGGDLVYIRALSDLIMDNVNQPDPNTMEALAISISRMAESICARLETRIDSLREVQHG